MNKNFLTKIIVFSLLVIFFSCEALPFNRSSSQSWLIPESENTWTTLTLLDVQVDRIGGWDSIERETLSLAPLYFWGLGCKVVSAGEEPEYAARIQIRERDFDLGWESKKSLSVEVYIWTYKDAPENGAPVQDQRLPLAVGRVVVTGDKSFSSSETMGRLLSKAIQQVVKKLAAYKR